MGNWIGGDRDGNPNVDADDARHGACSRHAEIVLRHYLTEVHRARRGAFDLADAGAVLAGPAGAGRAIRRRQLASGGRALPPRAHRHLQPARRHAAGPDRHRGAAPRDRARRALPQGRRLPRRPHDHPPVAGGQSRRRHGPQPSRAADPGRAGVRLPSRHHRSAPELRPARGRAGGAAGGGAHRGRLRRPAGGCASRRSCSRSFRIRAPCGCAASPTARRREQRARRLREGPQAAGGLRPRDHPPLHHQPHRERQRSPGGARPAEGERADARHSGARRGRPRRARPHRRAAVRDHRGPALGRGDHARLLRPAGHRGPAAQLGRRAGRHARLLRQQQGRRLLHRQLGALPGLDRARAHVRGQARPDAAGSSTAAAAPSVAAAARATRRSWRSRPAR